MNESSVTVAMIGLGIMGSALASAILASGLDLTVWNRSAAKCGPLVEQGAVAAASVADAVAGSEVVVVCVRGYDAQSPSDRWSSEASVWESFTVTQSDGPMVAEPDFEDPTMRIDS